MIDQAKQQLLHYGRQMIARGLTTGSGGNLSILLRTENQLVITPSGLEYNDMTAEDMVVCSSDGHFAAGRRRPSSEIGFHLALYRQRPEIAAVAHTHSVYATTLACMHREIPPVHYLVGFSGPKVPLAPYATFGSQALAEAVAGSIGTCNAVLLANHGLVAVGRNLPAAFNVAEEIELVARIYYQTLVAGEPKILSEAQMAEALEKFKDYGQKQQTEG